jgi:hypothetical protein
VLERHVDERALPVGEELLAVPELAADLEPPPALVLELGRDRESAVDVDRLEEPDREPRRYRRKAVPRREQAARLVERRADQPAVDQPRRGLMLLTEREGCVVRAQALPLGCR